jgi:hypothetical protein
MTFKQEEALYDFLENITEPFSLEDITAFIRMIEPKRSGRLNMEISALIDMGNVAFRYDNHRWISRRGCFESVPFVISPTRVELLNGILIPGHRCLPFANPAILPQDLRFFWKGDPIPVTTTEAPPEEFYPFYSIFGEEYASQYVARDNPENESAFNEDPYEDPPEVSIHTLDMRKIYLEASFVPGDRFVARTMDWKAGIFELERVGKDEWSEKELKEWLEAAEGGFEDSFALLGPASTMEEQIAYAYWYGGKRMRSVPAYSLEEFLYEKTDRIAAVAYGIESRFWYAGKEIPDTKNLEGIQPLPDRTVIEEILLRRNIPVSEYVVQAYVRDALFRRDEDIPRIIERIVPPTIFLDEPELSFLSDYISDALEEYRPSYSVFTDQVMGPIRQRVGELHTAVIELSARLQKGDIDTSWLPKHTYIVLSQIQGHAAGILEDLDTGDPPAGAELEAMDNSLDSMIETYEDIRELIDESLDSFRRNNLSVVKPNTGNREQGPLTLQVSIGGIDVWRRLLVPQGCRLADLHRVIQSVFNWKNNMAHRFYFEKSEDDSGHGVDEGQCIGDIYERGIHGLIYEYSGQWTVKVLLLAQDTSAAEDTIRCVAGAGAAPPQFIDGPLRFKKMLFALEKGGESEKRRILHELGAGFNPDLFDLESCNKDLHSLYLVKKPGVRPVKMDN